MDRRETADKVAPVESLTVDMPYQGTTNSTCVSEGVILVRQPNVRIKDGDSNYREI